MTDIQRELSRRGLYDGPVDGVTGRRPTRRSAISRPREAEGAGEPTEDVLRRSSARRSSPSPRRVRSAPDPIADLIAPAPRVIAVQRALNDFGYGPVKATGNYGSETIAAIQKFERDRKLPVTGQISPRLMRSSPR